MSPMTMAILGLLAWKAVKHLSAASPARRRRLACAEHGQSRRQPGGGTGGGLGDLLKGAWAACSRAAPRAA